MTVPPRPTEPTIPVIPQPQMPPVASPVINAPAPVMPQTSLPQPIAPFSTPRPASLGETVINPPTPSQQAPVQDIGSLMNQELNAASTQPMTAPQTPPPQPASVLPQVPPVQ